MALANCWQNPRWVAEQEVLQRVVAFARRDRGVVLEHQRVGQVLLDGERLLERRARVRPPDDRPGEPADLRRQIVGQLEVPRVLRRGVVEPLVELLGTSGT